MTAALEGGEWSAARPGRTLPPGKNRYPFYRGLGVAQDRSGRAENLVPTGIRSRTNTHTHTHKHTHTHTHIYIYKIQDTRKRLYAFVDFNTVSNDKKFTHLKATEGILSIR